MASLFLAVVTTFIYAPGSDNSSFATLLFAPLNPYFSVIDIISGHPISAHWDFWVPLILSFLICLGLVFRQPRIPQADKASQM